ncbi:hypothetical protein, partial [Bilophila wadsworthia]|uniref:hypothetical protein n=1 Tax=Bilophila wadsworthia TaxID=35833 RepID=UPI0026DC27B9
KPAPFPPKTFDLIESLLLVFRVDEKLFHRYGWEEFFIWGYWCCPYWRGGAALLENVQVHHHHLHLHLLLRRKREPTHSIRRESRHEGFDKEEKFRGKRGGGSGEGRRGPF